jgi:hypothetical protein
MTPLDRPLSLHHRVALHHRAALHQQAIRRAQALRDAALDAACTALWQALRGGYFSLKASLAPRPAKAAAKPTLSHP